MVTKNNFLRLDILCTLRIQFMIMKNLKLTATEKDFFKKVRLAIVANPFSDEREAVNSQLTQSKSSLSNKKLVELLIKTVEEQLSLTCSGEKKPILCFQGEDRELVQYGVLFYIFHKYCSNFDQHIGIS